MEKGRGLWFRKTCALTPALSLPSCVYHKTLFNPLILSFLTYQMGGYFLSTDLRG